MFLFFPITQLPFSKYILQQYIENAHQDIYEAKQLRLAICLNNSTEAIGLIDLFEFDPMHQRAGIGIVVLNDANRNVGIGTEALSLLIDYAFNQLQLHQLFANIGSKNEISIALFFKFGFEKIGIKKDWNKINGSFEDEILYQLINR